jgi:hypothetical protein
VKRCDSSSARERTNAMQGIVAGEARPLPPPSPPEVSKTPSKNEDQRPHDTATSTNKSFARQQSNDGGMRIAIADQWKQHMIAVHPRSHDDQLDILLAHQYRLSLKTAPRQSFFRVVALVFFSRVVDGIIQSERYHVVGTNDEPNSIGGSICAERAALMQLRFIPDLKEITKVVIVTDEVDAISPGVLCREFMASHNCIPWDVRIVLGRSVCSKCGLTVSGRACSDVNGCFDTTKNITLRDVNAQLFVTCSRGHEESKHKDYSTPHDFLGVRVTLRDLFPYPSLYARMTANEALKFGEDFIKKKAVSNPLSKNDAKMGIRAHSASVQSDDGETVGTDRHIVDTDGRSALHHLTARSIRMPEHLKPSQRRDKLMRLATEVTALESHMKHVHPIRYGAAVLFSDGTVAIASQKVALEFGCTLDAVGQVSSVFNVHRVAWPE